MSDQRTCSGTYRYPCGECWTCTSDVAVLKLGATSEPTLPTCCIHCGYGSCICLPEHKPKQEEFASSVASSAPTLPPPPPRSLQETWDAVNIAEGFPELVDHPASLSGAEPAPLLEHERPAPPTTELSDSALTRKGRPVAIREELDGAKGTADPAESSWLTHRDQQGTAVGPLPEDTLLREADDYHLVLGVRETASLIKRLASYCRELREQRDEAVRLKHEFAACYFVPSSKPLPDDLREAMLTRGLSPEAAAEVLAFRDQIVAKKKHLVGDLTRRIAQLEASAAHAREEITKLPIIDPRKLDAPGRVEIDDLVRLSHVLLVLNRASSPGPVKRHA